jgi:HlyD family secretion protein
MSRRQIAIWSVLMLGVMGAATLWVWPRIFGEVVAANRVERREVVQTVVATGRVETPSRVEIGTQVIGVVAGVLVVEGDRVKAGDILIRLEEGELRANLDLARAGVLQAEDKLLQVAEFTLPNAQQAIDQAKANQINAQNLFERARLLSLHGNATAVQLDEARRAMDVAASQVRIAELQFVAASPGGADVRLAEAALAQAKASLQIAEARLGYIKIHAPADGIVMTRSIEPGTIAQMSKALLVISPTRETRLVIQIDERNLGLIATGQPALASADAYPQARFKAVLAFINPAVDPARGSVEVKLSVPEPPDYLREDMTVSVDIEVARHPNVLVLPTNAVRDSLSAAPWVLAVSGNETLRKPVKIGARGAVFIEILDGLVEGEHVVPAIDTGTKAGQRVRLRMM